MVDPRSPLAPDEATYSLGAVSRLTGLSGHVLRAWERRYGAVTPQRTAGGTRRYTGSDVARLKLLVAAVEAGHPIGSVAALSDDALRERAEAFEAPPRPPLEPILEAIHSLDADTAERLLGLQLSALGPRRFVMAVVDPVLREVGERWEKGDLCVASEHLVSTCLRSLLGTSLRRGSSGSTGPPIVFTTLSDDRHELGALSCAVAVAELGAHPVYLGPDLPPEEIASACGTLGAAAVALSMSAYAPEHDRERALAELRDAVSSDVLIWVGGSGVEALELPAGVERMADLAALEHAVSLLGT